MVQKTIRLYESSTILNRASESGSGEELFYVLSGARMLVTFKTIAIDEGATVSLFLENTFSDDEAYEAIDTLTASATGTTKRIYSDFNQLFKFRFQVTGGSATFKVAVTMADNASTTKIENAQISVNLDHTSDVLGHFDSVRIGDGTDLLGINADGSINVRFDNADDESMMYPYNGVASVPSGSESLVLSYTVPAMKTGQLYRVECSGDNIARFRVYKNGTAIGTKRTYFGGNLNADFNFLTPNKQALGLAAGDVVEVKVLHYRPVAGSFEAMITAMEKG